MEQKMSTSRVKKLFGSFTFRIENYSGLSTRVGDSTESPEFELCGHMWQLRIFPGGSLEVHRGHVSFYLASKSNRAARAAYKLLVINQSPVGVDETFASSGIRTFEARGVQVDGWGRDKFMTCASLADSNQHFIRDDTVIFKVEITVYGELESTGFPVVASLHSASSTCLTKCMHNLLMDASPSTADLLLVVGKNRKMLWCHRCILAARSKVFHAMLLRNVSDSQAESWARQVLIKEDENRSGAEMCSRDSDSDASSGSSSSSSSSSSSKSSTASKTAAHGPERKTSLMMATNRPTAAVLACLGVLNQSTGRLNPNAAFAEDEECKDPYQPNSNTDEPEESKLMGPDAHIPVPSVQQTSGSSSAAFLESYTGVVVIPDMEPDIVQEFLCWCYTDALSDVTVLNSMAVPLLAIASKYEIPSLFSFVEEYLCLQLCVDNCLSMLSLSDAHAAVNLKALAMKMVVANALVLTTSSEYKYLHAILLAEVEKSLEDVQRLQQCCITGSGGPGGGDAQGVRRVTQCTIA